MSFCKITRRWRELPTVSGKVRQREKFSQNSRRAADPKGPADPKGADRYDRRLGRRLAQGLGVGDFATFCSGSYSKFWEPAGLMKERNDKPVVGLSEPTITSIFTLP